MPRPPHSRGLLLALAIGAACALGSTQGSILTGNLVLQAQGDLTMGGRTTPKGQVDFRIYDHLDSPGLPRTKLTPENPLAGLNQIAQQVHDAGITQVQGDVAIDDRLWKPDPFLTGLDPQLDPIMINDNVIDVQVTPTPRTTRSPPTSLPPTATTPG